MVKENDIFCPLCGGHLHHYDNVKRLIRQKYGVKNFIFLERKKCNVCGHVHRVITNDILPYKHYKRSIIEGVLLGFIFSSCIEFEDYPSESTMLRWIREKNNCYNGKEG